MTAVEGAPVLEIRNLSKTFPGQRALDGVDLDVRAGEIHALLGQNGSGKSTVIKVLAGYHAPDPGAEILVDGEALRTGVAGAGHALGLRFVHQDLGLVAGLNVIDNLALGRQYRTGRFGRIRWRAESVRAGVALRDLGLDVDPYALVEKMIARHPHVFGTAEVESAQAQTLAWEDTKASERRDKAAGRGATHSLLDDMPLALPALTRAIKLQKRAARGGFDWPEAAQVLDKIEEEIGELRAELSEAAPERLTDEVGDLLFSLANLARHLGIDPEEALRRTNRKFERRFRAIERALAAGGRRLEDTPLDELEALWQRSKAAGQ